MLFPAVGVSNELINMICTDGAFQALVRNLMRLCLLWKLLFYPAFRGVKRLLMRTAFSVYIMAPLHTKRCTSMKQFRCPESKKKGGKN